eukprot:CAMPEP_0171952174 /NCGR_PEP_ID=MMETSP0993-20121228/88842_1 /TAXON_ID=483369 /ORGANISM="non described non described, Strain CCMP2098" /LENGTH=201 /DNA_ID=CAMNT_0012597539 /DNA_START=141 /DNA_END=743 /DNA_ORIENTATION=-
MSNMKLMMGRFDIWTLDPSRQGAVPVPNIQHFKDRLEGLGCNEQQIAVHSHNSTRIVYDPNNCGFLHIHGIVPSEVRDLDAVCLVGYHITTSTRNVQLFIVGSSVFEHPARSLPESSFFGKFSAIPGTSSCRLEGRDAQGAAMLVDAYSKRELESSEELERICQATGKGRDGTASPHQDGVNGADKEEIISEGQDKEPDKF